MKRLHRLGIGTQFVLILVIVFGVGFGVGTSTPMRNAQHVTSFTDTGASDDSNPFDCIGIQPHVSHHQGTGASEGGIK